MFNSLSVVYILDYAFIILERIVLYCRNQFNMYFAVNLLNIDV